MNLMLAQVRIDMSLYKKITSTVLAMTFIVALGCNERYRFTSFVLRSDLQYVTTDSDQLLTTTDSIIICYSNNYIVYKLPFTAMSFKAKNAKDGSALMEQTSEQVKYNIVVQRLNQRYGYWFDSLRSERPRRISMDSLLNRRAFGNFPFFKESLDTVISKSFNASTNTLIQKCIPKKRLDESFPDTIYYSFSKEFSGIRFSFSKTLDSLTNMKMFKVEFINNMVPKGNNGKDLARRTFLFQLKKSKIDTTSIIQFVARFKKMEGTLPTNK